MRGVYWHAKAWDSYVEIQQEKQTLKKTNALIKDIQRNGFSCSYGKPEMLKGHLQGYASVKIDKKNRLRRPLAPHKTTPVELFRRGLFCRLSVLVLALFRVRLRLPVPSALLGCPCLPGLS